MALDAMIHSRLGDHHAFQTVIDGLTFDVATKDPLQLAIPYVLIGFMAATAQAQANKETQRAGIDHAKGWDTRPEAEAEATSDRWAL